MKTVEVKCPRCGAGKDHISYVQTATEYWSIAAVYEDGSVDLENLQDSFPGDSYGLSCDKCGHDFTLGS